MNQSTGALDQVRATGDSSARLLVKTDASEWIRSQFGILGLVHVPLASDATAFGSELEGKIAAAYTDLEGLPGRVLSSDDLWNLLLFISVPWTEREVLELEIIRDVMSQQAANLKGSRKIILWRDASIGDHIGPLGFGRSTWGSHATDPLRDVLLQMARNNSEADALLKLLQRRIVESDLDELIAALGQDASKTKK